MTNLLQRIYDAANDVVTADVDNTNTTTDTLKANAIKVEEGADAIQNATSSQNTIGFENYDLADTNQAPIYEDIPTNQVVGVFAIINKTAGLAGLAFFSGGNQNTEIVVDPDNEFASTSGNAGTVNVFYDSGVSEYVIENQTGSNALVDIIGLI